MKEFQSEILQKLQNARKFVFLGIGEEKLRDDGFGPYIISELLKFSGEKFLFINAGIDPMSRIEEIINFQPSHLIIFDTCTLKKPPGTVAIIERENIKESVPISSHTIPIHIVVDLIIEKLANLNVFMIGIVPESLEGFSELNLYKEDEFSIEERSEHEDLPFFDINLTDTIKKVANQIIEIIKEILLKV
jgi:hydrogenase maturation protease